MTTDIIAKGESSIVKDYPAYVRSAAASGVALVAGYVLPFLVLHGVITGTQASEATQLVVPAVTAVVSALLILLVGKLITDVVSPMAKFAERVQIEVEARLKKIVASPDGSYVVTAAAPFLTSTAGQAMLDQAKSSPLGERVGEDLAAELKKLRVVLAKNETAQVRVRIDGKKAGGAVVTGDDAPEVESTDVEPTVPTADPAPTSEPGPADPVLAPEAAAEHEPDPVPAAGPEALAQAEEPVTPDPVDEDADAALAAADAEFPAEPAHPMPGPGVQTPA